MMRNVSRVLLAAALVAALVSAVATMGLAKTTTAPMRIGAGPGSITIDERQINVKVIGVSQAARTVTLQMPDGKIMTYKVGKDVRSFGLLKKGDMIRATVIDALAVYVQKSGGRPTTTETQTVMLNPRGAKPGMIAANTIRITGKVQLVNMQNRMVTITGPGYGSKAFKVGPNVDLRGLRAGDDIVLRYTEAVALDLQRPMK